MRIYLPVTISDLQSTQGISARRAYAVTSELRQLSPDLDEEGLEYVAFLAAADSAIDQGEITRIVLAADAPGTELGALTAVDVQQIPWSHVVSIHIDDLSDAILLADIQAAQIGDAAARDRVNEADLMWYDIAEKNDVIALIAAI